ncbi:WD repeat-containing protein 86-like [Cherax quadricarinatus]
MGSGSSKRKDKSHLLETLKEHKDSIMCLALTDDSSLLVTGSYDTTACLWSTMSDATECLGILIGHTGRIVCVATSMTFVYTGSEDSTIKKWDICTSDCIFTYSGHVSQVNRIMCAGDFLFSTSYDKTAKVWLQQVNNASTQEEVLVRTFEGHTKAVYPIIFLPGQDTGGVNEEGLKINPSDLVITGSTDTTAKSWALDMGICLKTMQQHTGPVTCMDTGAQGKLLFTGSDDCTVRVWEVSSGRCLRELRGHNEAVTCLKAVQRMLYTGSHDSKVKCWLPESANCTRTFKISTNFGSVTAIQIYKGILFVGYTDDVARAFDAKSGSLKRVFQGHTDSVSCLAVWANKLYTGSSDGTLRVWDVSNISTETSSEESEDELNHHVELDFDLERYLGDDVDQNSKPDE